MISGYAEFIESCLNYNPDTGVFVWKQRPLYQFKNLAACNSFNSKFVGKDAGSLMEHGYQSVSIQGKKEYLHRLAFVLMTGELPSGQVDHINGNRSDNRWCNLRDVSASENCKNSSISARNSSGYVGITYRPKNATHVWRAQIGSKGKLYELGCYEDIKDALRARALAEIHFNFHRNHGSCRMQYN